MDTRSVALRAAAIGAVALISGCSYFETPFALTLGKVDEDHDQQSAVISIGDPQVYARETLINDRRKEIIFLTREIEKVDKDEIHFTPQIARDLSTLAALRVALGVAYDPLAGQRTQQDQAREGLAQERELLQLQQEIEYEKQKLDNLRAKTVQEASASEQPAPKAGEPTRVEIATLLKSMEDLRADLEKLKGDPRSKNVMVLGGKPAEFAVAPIDEFRDKQAYRAELRAALQAVNLDDLHDFGGNALYRLQFQGTLFPGEHKAQFGAAQLELEPPILLPQEVNGLFYSWIGHAGQKLNTYMSDVRSYYEVVGRQIRVYDTLLIKPDKPKPDAPKKRIEPLRLPVPPGVSEQMLRGASVATTADFTERTKELSCDGVEETVNLVLAVQMVDATLSKLEVTYLDNFKDEFLANYAVVRSDVLRARDKSKCREKLEKSFAFGAPLAFRQALLRKGEESCPGDKCRLFGKAYAYATTPVELGQRVSTTASAARSFELALAASANLALAGVDAKGGLNLARSASGHVDAIERLPLTIGYSSRVVKGKLTDADSQYEALPQFGWVFGPGVRLDAENNRLTLIQTARAETLTADLSVPAWWPSARFVVRTSWIKNWYAGTKVLGDGTGDSESISVTLPKKPTDMDLLTNKLMASADFVGSMARKPYIETITPNRVSACAGKVTFAIKGTNIWRSTEIFLGGLKAQPSSISVLPDMEGVSVEFDVAQLFTAGLAKEEDESAASGQPDRPSAAATAPSAGSTSTSTTTTMTTSTTTTATTTAAATPAPAPAKDKDKDKEKDKKKKEAGPSTRSLDTETRAPASGADGNSERVDLVVWTRSGKDAYWVNLAAEKGAAECAGRRRLIAPDR